MGPQAGEGLTGLTLPPPTAPGQQSSRDEQGACAVLAVHLNTLLGERPVQHREVQGNESDLFMSYFPRGLKYQVSLPCGFSQSPAPSGGSSPSFCPSPSGIGCGGAGPPASPLRLAIWAAGRRRGVSISQGLQRGHPRGHQEAVPGEGEEEYSRHRAGAELGQLQHRGLLHPGPGPGG